MCIRDRACTACSGLDRLSENLREGAEQLGDDVAVSYTHLYYSLDCDNGIENAILLKHQTPEMLLEEKQLREDVYKRQVPGEGGANLSQQCDKAVPPYSTTLSGHRSA